jgi:hypothetical protein
VELRWRDVVVCDYEIELSDSALVEYDLYGRGLQAAPRVLLGEREVLGSTRRPGVIDIPAAVYDTFCARVRARLLTLTGALAVRSAFDDARTQLAAALDALDAQLRTRARPSGVGGLIRALDRVMAFHTLNWLLPVQEAQRHLAGLFEADHAARVCLLALMVPATPAHLLDVHALLLDAARTADAALFAEQAGFLHAQGMATTAWEDPTTVAAVLHKAAARHGGDLAGQVTGLRAAHARASGRRDALYAAALLASAGDPAVYERTQAIAVTCRLAADEEEFRKVAQQRTLRGLRRLACAHGFDPMDLPLSEFAACAHSGANAPAPAWWP